MRSISEFIMEQENISSDSYEIDSAYIKEFAEYQAANALVNCYTEQLAVMEFADENGISSLNIVMEADNEKKDNIFKKAGKGIKFVWGKLMDLIHIVAGKIKNFFTHKKAKKKAEEIKDEVEEISKDVSDNTSMGEVINDNSNSITEVDANFVVRLETIYICLADLYSILDGINEMISNTKKENDASIMQNIKTHRETFKADKQEYEDLLKRPVQSVSFGQFRKYAEDMESKINKISQTKTFIDQCTSRIKTAISDMPDELDDRNKYIKARFDEADKAYNGVIKQYDALVKIFNKQKDENSEIEE